MDDEYTDLAVPEGGDAVDTLALGGSIHARDKQIMLHGTFEADQMQLRRTFNTVKKQLSKASTSAVLVSRQEMVKAASTTLHADKDFMKAISDVLGSGIEYTSASFQARGAAIPLPLVSAFEYFADMKLLIKMLVSPPPDTGMAVQVYQHAFNSFVSGEIHFGTLGRLEGFPAEFGRGFVYTGARQLTDEDKTPGDGGEGTEQNPKQDDADPEQNLNDAQEDAAGHGASLVDIDKLSTQDLIMFDDLDLLVICITEIELINQDAKKSCLYSETTL